VGVGLCRGRGTSHAPSVVLSSHISNISKVKLQQMGTKREDETPQGEGLPALPPRSTTMVATTKDLV
jgi:hypothetical protein